jgi:cytochrome c biogenesis protein
MNGLKRFFLARSTILSGIILAVGAMLVGSVIPQAILLTPGGLEKWHADYPWLAPQAERLGLTHLYVHPAFALIIAFAFISLLLSCIEQVKAAWQRTFAAMPLPGGGTSEFTTAAAEPEIARLLRSAGYLRIGGGSPQRYLCHPWGLWGNCLLHAGMVLVIAASLWIALTQQRGMLQLAEGDVYRPDQPWTSSETGLLAPPLTLDESVRLEKLSYDYWPAYGVKTLTSSITFLRGATPVAERLVEINSILSYRSLRVYQSNDFGHAFYLEIIGPAGKKQLVQFLINHQERPELAAYNVFPDVLGGGDTLRTKYYVDDQKLSLTRESPLLVLRLDRAGREQGQLPLKLGSAGSLGPYQFRLLKITRWGSLIFVRLAGMEGVFFGFAIIILGGILNYFTPPREVALRKDPAGGTLVSWRALKFPGFYQDEYLFLKKSLAGEQSRDE